NSASSRSNTSLLVAIFGLRVVGVGVRHLGRRGVRAVIDASLVVVVERVDRPVDSGLEQLASQFARLLDRLLLAGRLDRHHQRQRNVHSIFGHSLASSAATSNTSRLAGIAN